MKAFLLIGEIIPIRKAISGFVRRTLGIHSPAEGHSQTLLDIAKHAQEERAALPKSHLPIPSEQRARIDDKLLAERVAELAREHGETPQPQKREKIVLPPEISRDIEARVQRIAREHGKIPLQERPEKTEDDHQRRVRLRKLAEDKLSGRKPALGPLKKLSEAEASISRRLLLEQRFGKKARIRKLSAKKKSEAMRTQRRKPQTDFEKRDKIRRINERKKRIPFLTRKLLEMTGATRAHRLRQPFIKRPLKELVRAERRVPISISEERRERRMRIMQRKLSGRLKERGEEISGARFLTPIQKLNEAERLALIDKEMRRQMGLKKQLRQSRAARTTIETPLKGISEAQRVALINKRKAEIKERYKKLGEQKGFRQLKKFSEREQEIQAEIIAREKEEMQKLKKERQEIEKKRAVEEKRKLWDSLHGKALRENRKVTINIEKSRKDIAKKESDRIMKFAKDLRKNLELEPIPGMQFTRNPDAPRYRIPEQNAQNLVQFALASKKAKDYIILNLRKNVIARYKVEVPNGLISDEHPGGPISSTAFIKFLTEKVKPRKK